MLYPAPRKERNIGSNISRTASVERIHETAKKTMVAAQARGGDVLAQAEAARPAESSYAQITSLSMQRRALADGVQVSLVRYTRDLKNLGMTEAQVHEIIPDATSGSSAAAQPAPKPAA